MYYNCSICMYCIIAIVHACMYYSYIKLHVRHICLLTETMKQFDSSVFDGPILGIISRVFDVRRHFLDGYVFHSPMFEFDF